MRSRLWHAGEFLTHDSGQPWPRVTGVPISRRGFLSGAAFTAGAMMLGCSSSTAPQSSANPSSTSLPDPKKSGIKHIVVVMMENRSFDHFLGWLPGADGKQEGLTFTDRAGAAHQTHHLTDFQGCAFHDPSHAYRAARIAFNNGACDGWLKVSENDDFAIGFYQGGDLPFLGQAARDWTVCDRYFAAVMGPTIPNRLYMHCAQTDRLTDDHTPPPTLPTIWDQLAAHGLSARYFKSNSGVLKLWGNKYLSTTHHLSTFFDNCKYNNLAHVSFVDPAFSADLASNGPQDDDHPPADIRNGEVFLNQVYSALKASAAWPSVVLVINFDEWGGFYEHVAPPTAPLPDADKVAGNDGQLGFRVPCLVISPMARRGYISNTVFDHTSVLKMIEWRWGLDPLTVRDATANNLADVLDFNNTNTSAPDYSVPAGPFGGPCATSGDVVD